MRFRMFNLLDKMIRKFDECSPFTGAEVIVVVYWVLFLWCVMV